MQHNLRVDVGDNAAIFGMKFVPRLLLIVLLTKIVIFCIISLDQIV